MRLIRTSQVVSEPSSIKLEVYSVSCLLPFFQLLMAKRQADTQHGILKADY